MLLIGWSGGSERGVPASTGCWGKCTAAPGPPAAGLPRPLSRVAGAFCPSLSLLPLDLAGPCRGAPSHPPPPLPVGPFPGTPPRCDPSFVPCA